MDILSGQYTASELAKKHRVSESTVIRFVRELQGSSHIVIRKNRKPKWEGVKGTRIAGSLTTKKAHAIRRSLGRTGEMFTRAEVLDILEKFKETRDVTMLLEEIKEQRDS